ncbi:MAG TPA: HAD-IA family hydrolase [Tepidisphaeraceae bacterium]|jgi:HAD superfamily hydrolase (TIGR01509 family)|nr:HAD-IA family hydrolase [Tepidisphaeraceae bacterium]
MALSAIIFDVDGTLIDSNDAHAHAWDCALKKHAYRVSADRIAVEIGKGGDKLVPSILGKEIDRTDGDSLRKADTAEFISIAESTHLPLFPGVKNLLTALRGRGLKLAIATSSKKHQLQVTQKSAGIDLAEFFDVIATGDDASESKPAPGILEAAIGKLKVSPAECAMIGDTPYDAQTARDAGVVCLGVTCGGMNDEQTLRATGMRAVYRDPADIHAHIDDAIRLASPGSAVLTQDLLESLMKEALAVAGEGLEKGEVPIGCVIASGDGTVISRAHDELNASQDKTAHAEMVAFRRLAGKVPTDARDLILLSTLEPCVMCLGASMEAAVDTIAFGLSAPTDGGRKRVRPPVSPESQVPRILGGVLCEQSRQLLEKFLKRKPANPNQVKFVRELLALS